MPINDTAKLGSMLTKQADEQDAIKDNISPDDSETQEQIYLSELIRVGGTVTINRKDYAANTFVIDHPVYGDIDSATLLIDGGYASQGGIQFPGSFPLTFQAGGDTELFTITF